MKLWPALSAALLLLALLTWLAIRGMTVATEPFQAALRDLENSSWLKARSFATC